MAKTDGLTPPHLHLQERACFLDVKCLSWIESELCCVLPFESKRHTFRARNSFPQHRVCRCTLQEYGVRCAHQSSFQNRL